MKRLDAKLIVFSTRKDAGGAHLAADKLYSELSKINVGTIKRHFVNLNITWQKIWYYFSVASSKFFTKLLGRSVLQSVTFFGIFDFRYLFELKKNDVLHIHWNSHAGIGLIYLAFICDSKIIVTFHDTWFLNAVSHGGRYSRKQNLIVKLKYIVLVKSCRIICPSEWMKNLILEQYPALINKISVIPNITGEFGDADRAKSANSVKSICAGPINLGVCYSNLFTNKAKGAALVRLVCERMYERGIDFRLIHAGRNTESLEDFSSVSYFGRIKFCGLLDAVQMKDFYLQLDLFLNLSHFENLSNTLVECLAHGVPAVYQNVGGNSEIFTGLGIEVDKIDSFSDIGRLDDLIDRIVDREEYSSVELKNIRKQRFKERYSKAAVIERHLEVYRNV